jgi:hypothetical protein
MFAQTFRLSELSEKVPSLLSRVDFDFSLKLGIGQKTTMGRSAHQVLLLQPK